MTQVFAVSSGSYSDYTIHHVFKNKVDAEGYIEVSKNHWGGDCGVEEWDLVEELPEPIDELKLNCTITDGALSDEREDASKVFPGLDHLMEDCQHFRIAYRGGTKWKTMPSIWIEVRGKDVERVRKVYSEKKAEALAMFNEIVESEGRK